MIAWLLFEVVMFYFHIFSAIIFLVTSRFMSFRPMRERLGLGGNLRYKIDFLEYCQDDIHWFLILFTQVFLTFQAYVYRTRKEDKHFMSLTLLVLKYIMEGWAIYHVFFTKKEIMFSKKACLCYITLSAFIYAGLGYFVYYSITKLGLFWSPFLFFEITISLCCYAQVLIDYYQRGLWTDIYKEEYLMVKEYSIAKDRGDKIDELEVLINHKKLIRRTEG
mmetsp:Transcript_9819/g.16533  ORF Transcript_9819/g.16533 Transcript_9819/m.16533 type:complete len:220 (-) Transcript_9819:920-1579(-)